MSKRYIVVETATLTKLLSFFNSQDSYLDFMGDFDEMCQEISFMNELALRQKDNPHLLTAIAAKNLLSIAIFARRNIDVLKDLVGVAEYKIVDSKDAHPNAFDFDSQAGIQ